MDIFKSVNLYSSGFIKDSKKLLILYFFTSIIYYILEVMGISYIVTNLNKVNKALIIRSVIILILLVVINYTKGLSGNMISSGINSYSRQKFLKAIIDKYKESFKDIRIGNFISRIFLVTLEYRFGFILFLKVIFPSILVMIICTAVIYKTDKNISLILCMCMLSMFILSYYGSKKISTSKINQEEIYYNDFDNLINKYNNLLNSYINNEVVNDKKILGTQQKGYSRVMLNADNEMNINTTILRGNLVIFLFAIIVYTYYMKGKMNKSSIGVLGIILIYFITNYLNYSTESSTFFSNLGISLGSYNFLNNFLQKKYHGHIKNIKNGSIKMENVSFSYKEDFKILNNFNISIKDKHKVAIMGRSGSVKSTLAKLTLKLHEYKGKIYVGNTCIKQIHTDTLRSKITYINQRTILLDIPVIDNMRYGNHASREKIVDLLKKYNLNSIFSGLQRGLNEKCLSGGANLSLGMQKIIILIRGIIKSRDSLIVFFDEPLAGLDQITRKKVIKMILSECSNKTVVIITHSKEIVPHMDKIYNMQDINKKD